MDDELTRIVGNIIDVTTNVVLEIAALFVENYPTETVRDSIDTAYLLGQIASSLRKLKTPVRS